jgi:hypothetical protein
LLEPRRYLDIISELNVFDVLINTNFSIQFRGGIVDGVMKCDICRWRSFGRFTSLPTELDVGAYDTTQGY